MDLRGCNKKVLSEMVFFLFINDKLSVWILIQCPGALIRLPNSLYVIVGASYSFLVGETVKDEIKNIRRQTVRNQ